MDKANIYTYHWDWQNSRWNVFDPDDNYITYFTELADAKGYCNAENEKLHQRKG